MVKKRKSLPPAILAPHLFFLRGFKHVQSYRIINWDDKNLNWDWDLGEKLTGTWDWDPPIKTPITQPIFAILFDMQYARMKLIT